MSSRPDDWSRVRETFEAAVVLPADRRSAYLSKTCGGDDALRQQVEALLASHERAKSFLETPAVPVAMIAVNTLPLEGQRLGTYQLSARIGAGGMGEVYRARDVRLGRDVAIKVLPPLFTADPERLARFEREARMLAALNHPHIGAIYGLEDADASPGSGQFAVRALVLELVEGETLAERLQRGPVSVSDALTIARQIADALDAAHEKGIVHRDLKPANVKITPDGVVKVLDFGLAKAAGGDSTPDLSQSPTLTVGATRDGIILGTAAYMSPEQAKGLPVDKRADLWAFGAVLYELLTGRRAFTGEGVSDTLAHVLMKEPDWTALPANTPASIRQLLRRCLEKDPKRRLHDIADVRIEIDETIAAPATGEGVAPVPVVPAAPRGRRVLLWAVAAVAVIAAGTTLLLWAPWRPPPAAAAPLRLEATLGADASLVTMSISNAPGSAATVVSPDGSQLAFVAQPHSGGAPRLYVRRLDQLAATSLAGTEGAAGPVCSPDGQWLGFFSDGKLRKIAVTGGAPVTLADAPNARGGSWAEDGTIVFTVNGLWRVSASGGTAKPLTTLAQGEAEHRWPQVLPGGRAVLYTVSATPANFTNAWLAVQPLPTGTPHIVQRGGFYGRYLPSGHLTWVRGGTLFAATFDLATLAVMGPAVPVLSRVLSTVIAGNAQVDVSHTGTLVYLPGVETASVAPLNWLTRDGKTTPLRATPAIWNAVQIAPDGRRLAFFLSEEAKTDVWTYDAARDALTRLTVDPGTHRNPAWTPDGRRLVYGSTRSGGAENLYWQRSDGSGDATRLTTSPNAQFPGSWHPSGRFLAFVETRPQTGPDLLILPVEGNEASGWKPGTPTVFLGGPFYEAEPRFSPDGRWLAYDSNESGAFEIYVRPFPGPGGKWQISTGGGFDAVWSRARRELLYLAPDGRIMIAAYTAVGDAFQAEKPRVWSETPVQRRPLPWNSFDLHPDGERVAMAPVTETTGPTHVTLIFNFFDELRRLAPTK
jgi:serine/threonine-protein kinase